MFGSKLRYVCVINMGTIPVAQTEEYYGTNLGSIPRECMN